MKPAACPTASSRQLKAVTQRRGMPFEWAFLLDALQTERDQGITIDTSQIRFRTPSRDVVLIDAPGHTEFLRNMITGASQADAALLIVDAVEGVREQTRRHGYLLQLLGVHQVAVVINKMDRIDYDPARYEAIKTEFDQSPAQSRPHSGSDYSDLGAAWRRRRAALGFHVAGMTARRFWRLSKASRRRARPISCRCAFRCRRSTNSTIAASSRAGSRPGALRSVKRSRSPHRASGRKCARSRHGRFRINPGFRCKRAPADRSASPSIRRFSCSAAT